VTRSNVDRVLLTVDPLGGVFGYSLALSKQLSSRGVEVIFATMGGALSPAQRRATAEIPNVVLCESTYALEWMDEPWADVDRARDWLVALEERFEPSLVHLNGYSHGSVSFRAPVVIVAHSCVASWWRAVFHEAAPPRYDHYRARVRAGLGAASAVVAPTRAMLRMLEREHGRLGCPVYIIPNGAAPEQFSAMNKEPFYLACGRLWDRAKNLSGLSERAAALPWPLWIAGEQLSPEGRTLPFPQNVVRLGNLSRPALARIMARSSVFLHPAVYEPFGLAPLEAALTGCALVLSDIESLREVWGDAAMYAPPGDIAAFTDAARRVAVNEPLQRELAAKASARALRFSEKGMGDAYFELYAALVGGVSPFVQQRRADEGLIA
jgi:glycosyltransferase involved in cell wall biosynthesis